MVIGLPLREYEYVSGILLELGDLGGSATVDLAEQITREQCGKDTDGDRSGFLNHGVWTGMKLMHEYVRRRDGGDSVVAAFSFIRNYFGDS